MGRRWTQQEREQQRVRMLGNGIAYLKYNEESNQRRSISRKKWCSEHREQALTSAKRLAEFNRGRKQSPESVRARAQNCRRDGTAFRRLLKVYKRNAGKRSLEWALSEDCFRSMTQCACHWCGVTPSQVVKEQSGDIFIYNGVDRLDSSLGYIPENCVSCCGRCNAAKSDMSVSEFLDRCYGIVTRHPKVLSAVAS